MSYLPNFSLHVKQKDLVAVEIPNDRQAIERFSMNPDSQQR